MSKSNVSEQTQELSHDNSLEVRNVPELRFPEFEGEWENKKIGDVAEVVSGGTPSKNKKEYWNGNINWYMVSDLSDEKYITKSERQITSEGVVNSTTKLINKNTILFSRKAPVGKIGLILNESTTNEDIYSIIVNEKYSFEFIYYHMKILNKEFQRKAVGSVIPGISIKDLKNIKISIPYLEEQKKLADFLSIIDKKISLLENKLNLSMKTKNTIMKNYYNNLSGTKTLKISEILDSSSSNITKEEIENNNGCYELYGADGLIKNIDFYEKSEQYISIIKDGAGVGRLNIHDPFSSVLSTMQYLTIKGDFDLYFLFYYLKNINFEKYIKDSTIPHIYFKDYSKEQLEIPPLSLQKEIGKLFNNFDKSNELIEKELILLKNYKKSLLQKLFI